MPAAGTDGNHGATIVDSRITKHGGVEDGLEGDPHHAGRASANLFASPGAATMAP